MVASNEPQHTGRERILEFKWPINTAQAVRMIASARRIMCLARHAWNCRNRPLELGSKKARALLAKFKFRFIIWNKCCSDARWSRKHGIYDVAHVDQDLQCHTRTSLGAKMDLVDCIAKRVHLGCKERITSIWSRRIFPDGTNWTTLQNSTKAPELHTYTITRFVRIRNTETLAMWAENCEFRVDVDSPTSWLNRCVNVDALANTSSG